MNEMLMLLCLLVGWWVGLEGRLPPSTPGALNGFCIKVSLPAPVLQHLHTIEFSSGVLMLAATPWIVFAATGALAYAAGRVWQLPKPIVECITLVCGTSNTSIIDIPLITTLVGSSAVGVALVIDQSNFIEMCTADLIVANLCAGGANSWRAIAWRIVAYRPVHMMVLALVLRPWRFAEEKDLAPPLTLLLVAVGIPLSFLTTAFWRVCLP